MTEAAPSAPFLFAIAGVHRHPYRSGPSWLLFFIHAVTGQTPKFALGQKQTLASIIF